MAAQANFVRVKVDALEGGRPGEAPPRPRLLCVVRALLKKIKQEVLVGDRVRLVGIDWTDGRGEGGWAGGGGWAGQTWLREAPMPCHPDHMAAAWPNPSAHVACVQAWWRACSRARAGCRSRRWQT